MSEDKTLCMCDGGGGTVHAPSHLCTVFHGEAVLNCPQCQSPLNRFGENRWQCQGECTQNGRTGIYAECEVCDQLHRAGRWKDWRSCHLSDKGIEQLRARVGLLSDAQSSQTFTLVNEIIRLRKQMRAQGIEPDMDDFAENGWE